MASVQEDANCLPNGTKDGTSQMRCPFASTSSSAAAPVKQRKPFVLHNLLEGTTMTDTLHQKSTAVSEIRFSRFLIFAHYYHSNDYSCYLFIYIDECLFTRDSVFSSNELLLMRILPFL